MSSSERIISLTLDEKSIIRRTPEVEHERAVAIADLLDDNHCSMNGLAGPYKLHLSLAENRLTLDMEGEGGSERLVLAVTPFRSIIKDYFMICESYFDAIKNASPSKIEAIDMARRGIHNEGSEQLRDLLSDRIKVDFETARRLFTLVCVLHIR